MRIAFSRRFVDSLQPTPEQERPERGRAGNDEHPETPGAVARVRIDSARASQRERDGKHQAAAQVNPQRNEKYYGNHGGVGLCPDFSSALSE